MKKWVNLAMLFTLVGSIASPVIGTAVEITTPSSTQTSTTKTIGSVASDPKSIVSSETAVSSPKTTENSTSSTTETSTEVTNQLTIDKKSKLKETEEQQTELTLIGKVDSSAENTSAITFETTKNFVPAEIKDDAKVILNEAKETIGTYAVETKADRIHNIR